MIHSWSYIFFCSIIDISIDKRFIIDCQIFPNVMHNQIEKTIHDCKKLVLDTNRKISIFEICINHLSEIQHLYSFYLLLLTNHIECLSNTSPLPSCVFFWLWSLQKHLQKCGLDLRYVPSTLVWTKISLDKYYIAGVNILQKWSKLPLEMGFE